MGIVLLLGAAFALLALSGKNTEGAASNLQREVFGPGLVEKFTWGDKSFAKLTALGKQNLFALLEADDYVVMPQLGQPGEGQVILPLRKAATGAVGQNANRYIAALLDTTDVTVWIDMNLESILVAEGSAQELYGSPLVMMTTGAEGWPPSGSA